MSLSTTYAPGYYYTSKWDKARNSMFATYRPELVCVHPDGRMTMGYSGEAWTGSGPLHATRSEAIAHARAEAAGAA